MKKHCQSLRVDEFGPLTLKTVREQMVASGLARVGVNAYVSKIKRMFAWGVENELVPVEIYQALRCVPGLRQGKTDAPETEPILPVADTTVEATLPFLSTIVADMVRFERFTGCRPAEVCIIRPGDVDDTNSVWVYRPFTHKTAHRGRGRAIFIGPRAQAILTPYLARPSDQFCFSPTESERARLVELHSVRQTPLRYGNRPGTNRRERPERKPGLRYTTDSYRRAIQRACDEAFPPPPGMNDSAAETWRAEHRWSPNQLRHSAATEIRQAFGLEAAQVTLGHARADVTQIYAERDNRLAAKIMGEVG